MFAVPSTPRRSPAGIAGERITLRGRVLDGDGAPVDDALIETWQADAHGRYAHAQDAREKHAMDNFRGLGRVLTSAADHRAPPKARRTNRVVPDARTPWTSAEPPGDVYQPRER